MSNTFSNLLFHVVFSTKERMKLLSKELRVRLYPYISSIANNNDFKVSVIGGTDDHIHILLSLKPDLSVSKAVQCICFNRCVVPDGTFELLMFFSRG